MTTDALGYTWRFHLSRKDTLSFSIWNDHFRDSHEGGGMPTPSIDGEP